jgi:hypothetical protein
MTIAAALLAMLPACAEEEAQSGFPVTFIANRDEPLAGVVIHLEGGSSLGSTGTDGILRVTLTGKEGDAVPFRMQCPDGYRAPRDTLALTLRRFTGLAPEAAARGIEVSLECRPAKRLAALVLATGRPGLSVLARGREIAETDQDGVAHALMSLAPNSTFRVVIDTTGNPRLRPKSPAMTLTVADQDEIFLIDQAFEVNEPPAAARPIKKKRPKKKVIKKSTPEPKGPEKLGPNRR